MRVSSKVRSRTITKRIQAIAEAVPIFKFTKAFRNRYSGYIRRLFCFPAPTPALRFPDWALQRM